MLTNGFVHDQTQSIFPVPPAISAERGFSSAYLDIVPTEEGYNHIALFTQATSDTPYFLTSGKWEVTDGIKAIDPVKGLV